MTGSTDTEIARVFERWHETVVARDLEGLMALYDENAVFESPSDGVEGQERRHCERQGRHRIILRCGFS